MLSLIRLGAGLSALASLALIPSPALASGLRFCFEDGAQPPWTQPDGSGLALDLLRQAAGRVHEEVELQPLPWKRCINEVASNRFDGAVGSADTPERRALGHLPTLADGKSDVDAALYVDYYYVYARSGSGAIWDGRQLVVPHGTVLIPRGYHLSMNLISHGYTVNESIHSGAEGLRMLQSGQADVAILPSTDTLTLAKNRRYRDSIVVSEAPWALSPGYLLVSNACFQQDAERIRRLWESIRVVRHSPAYGEEVRQVTGQAPIFADPSG